MMMMKTIERMKSKMMMMKTMRGQQAHSETRGEQNARESRDVVFLFSSAQKKTTALCCNINQQHAMPTRPSAPTYQNIQIRQSERGR